MSREGGADQSHRDATNINAILARYEESGQITHVKLGEPVYGDFTTMPEYHHAMTAVVSAQGNFERLPAEVREACLNDPGFFLDLLQSPEGQQRLIDAGLDLERAHPDDPEPGLPDPPSPAVPDPAAQPDPPAEPDSGGTTPT
ncbi:internal scaffolding protein [Microviridae sp.]|nr:internal scaffolding protein [Microviridae sp.]